MLAALVLALTVAASAEPAARSVITLQAPQRIVDIDTGTMPGDPLRLSWSPDGTQLFLLSVERDNIGGIKSTHRFVIPLDHPALDPTDDEPSWSSKYWAWKSGQISPAAPAFRIDVTQERKLVRSVAAPTGGAMARGGAAGDPFDGTPLGDVATAASTAQTVTVFTLKAKGTVIGEWTNEAVVPGLNFGWAPAPRRLLVYAKADGGPLMTLDDEGRKTELKGADKAILPAFSDDGTRLAWLERTDRKHYTLMIADVK
jgi:hypothetical protein